MGEKMNFVFDIDGTICFDGENIDSRLVETINRASDYGHQVSFASARSYRDVLPVIEGKFSPKYVVGLNGSMVHKNGILSLFKDITKELFDKISNFCINNEMPFFVDDLFDYYAYLPEEIPFIKFVNQLKRANFIELGNVNFPLKVVINMKNHHDKMNELKELINLEIAEIMYHEREELFYINPKNVNKATTLKVLFDKYVCFGNDKNDVEMFKNSICSVQIGDYKDLIKHSDIQIVDGENNIELICKKIIELFDRFRGH